MVIVNRFTGKKITEVANLRNADLCNANLRNADLRDADLRDSDLCNANLRNADLRDADLCNANLRNADLRDANLRDANLRDANLRNADLCNAKNLSDLIVAQLNICGEGDLIGYKKCQDDVIVKLLIPKEAKRSNATGRKCRAEYALVLELYGSNNGTCAKSIRDDTIYQVGSTTKPDSFNPDRWNECSNGIHFYLTKIEAENN